MSSAIGEVLSTVHRWGELAVYGMVGLHAGRHCLLPDRPPRQPDHADGHRRSRRHRSAARPRTARRCGCAPR
ncbi:MAG: hypothetical protein MZW92_35410 [Comamonadaceae bacterium]|nr:hypothetical protein [Comamonadaceae bacterium]